MGRTLIAARAAAPVADATVGMHKTNGERLLPAL